MRHTRMSQPLAKLTRRSAAMLAGLFALLLATCRGRSAGPVPTTPAAQVIASHSDTLMAIPGVVGVYEGRGAIRLHAPAHPPPAGRLPGRGRGERAHRAARPLTGRGARGARHQLPP